jgi:hypothetical protein
MEGIKGFITIGWYKKGYVVKIGGFLILKRCIGRGVQQNDFGRYLSISSEIRGIL